MNKFQLFLETTHEDLFRKATSELGALFYRTLDEGVYEVVYFSGSRIAIFKGKPTEQFAQFIRNVGYAVKSLDVDEIAGQVKIKEA